MGQIIQRIGQIFQEMWRPNSRRIFICDDACFDIFRLLPPKKVGLEVAAVSDRFDAVVDAQFGRYRKWTLGELGISSHHIVGKLNRFEPTEILPFPQIPLPNSVVGFSRINICSHNSDAIAFLQRIGRLLQSNISLEFSHLLAEETWDAFATSVLPQLNLSAIIGICLEDPSQFRHFRRVTSPSILRNCANLQTVVAHHRSPQFPPDDSDGSSDGQALCQWLHTPRADGLPKILCSFVGLLFPMDELKKHFLRATTPVNFIVRLRWVVGVAAATPFKLFNWFTDEQMTCRRIGDCWTIVRCPLIKNEKQWAEWEKEAVERRFGNDWKVICIYRH